MENTQTITTEVLINTSNEKVWEALFTKFGETFLYNPNVERSHYTNGKLGEIGCERQCNINSKTFVKEKITNAEPMKSVTVDLIGGNMPMVKEMQIVFDIKQLKYNQTNVLLTAYFTTKPSFMGIIAKGMFKKMLTNVLIGLKYHLETGRSVSKETFKPIYKQYRNLQLFHSFN